MHNTRLQGFDLFGLTKGSFKPQLLLQANEDFRIFQICKGAIITIDPLKFSVTNTFPFDELQNLTINENREHFSFVWNNLLFTYSCEYRSHLLCVLHESMSKYSTNTMKSYGPFNAVRLRKSGNEQSCKINVEAFGLTENNSRLEVVQSYKWYNISKIGYDEASFAFYFEYSGRMKVFLSPDFFQILNSCRQQLRLIGLENLPIISNLKLSVIVQNRMISYSSIPVGVSSFEVNKWSRRSPRPIAKQLHLSEEYLLETDNAAFYASSFRRIVSIYALVRSWRNAREFKIEFDDETSVTYTATLRDTILALLIDVCRACGNTRVIVSGEVSDGLRVMPRFAQESYQASIKDTFFGSGSIEVWYLSRLSKLCKQRLETSLVVDACREFNANIQCPGISTNSDQMLVKSSLVGILTIIQNEVIKSIHSSDLSNSRSIVVLLQSLFRIVPCVHGYKCFVEVKEVDTRKLLYQLLRYDDDFVNYWALELLMVLIRCPMLPRNMQQEFVNKHTLLSEETLGSLFDLISNRIILIVDDKNNTSTRDSACSNESENDRNEESFLEGDDKMGMIGGLEAGAASFIPNSLVVIGSASLLESLVCSRKDTTTPELFQQVLEMMMERADLLINMLRSNSFLIMENAAILMFILMKHRPSVAKYLKEAALCEALALKHFYTAVFSSSSSQRFISRFLVAAWMSGAAKTNPAKELLYRILPAALIEFLKFEPISEDHRKTLDEIEDDYYRKITGHPKQTVEDKSNKPTIESNAVGDIIRQRMANRISGIVSDSSNSSGKASKQPENYRVLFHMITQDHRLPDLIWNEQTRLELRSALIHEINEYEREQRLQGTRKIAWNYQQFEVKYDSLQDEMKIGSVFVRYFLDSDDAFLRSLENPPPQMLFEKLFRRILVNVQSNSTLAVLCTKCLCRLYVACRDMLGSFDDMIILVKMLQQANDLELQQYLLDLLLLLVEDPTNLKQLLDKHFVDVMIQYVSLAHINPLQIGNLLMRSTSQNLMIENSNHTGVTDHSTSASTTTNFDKSSLNMKSTWIPFDENCPRVWFVAPPSSLPPARQSQKGPYRVSDLINELETHSFNADWVAAALSTEEADDENFQAIVDTGRWKVLCNIFQLRMQIFMPGQAIYSPAQVSSKGLQLLQKISGIHKSSNSQGVPFYPIPLSKRIMSETRHIHVFAQLLLSNDPIVVDAAAKLIKSLVELNSMVNAKLYLSGVFYFASRYSGNNYRIIAELFAVTHLRQGFHDSATAVAQELPLQTKSILGTLFPPAMVSILHNYGPEKFATVQSGDYDTPEVIWNSKLRHHLVEMIDQHLGDFPARLRQFTLAEYEYCPIARIRYPVLDKEIYVHEYYLRNLCDEIRFPDWPIADPLALLRECLERWKLEVSKSAADASIEDALKILQLPKNFSNSALRKAYKNLARIHHPDKNPAGRDFFEKIYASYELLSSYELQEHERNNINLILLLKTQILIYRRYPDSVGDQKYPCYHLIIDLIDIPSDPTTPLPPTTSERMELNEEPSNSNINPVYQTELLVSCATLLYYTTFISVLNARELTKVGGALPKLHHLLGYVKRFCCSPTGAISNSSAPLVVYDKILLDLMRTFTAIATTAEGRSEINDQLATKSNFILDVSDLLDFYQSIPSIVELVLEFFSRCCSLQALQYQISRAGTIWKAVPFLLNFDSTYVADEVKGKEGNGERLPYNQGSSNNLAILSAKFLGRLGGYMFNDLKTDVNIDVKDVLRKILTPSIAVLLRNRDPTDLLLSLNENVESTTKIWNVKMRKELIEYLQVLVVEREPGVHDLDLLKVKEFFVFTNLKEELVVGNVYIRIFNQTRKTEDIENISIFCHQLIECIGFTIVANYSSNVNFDFLPDFDINMSVEDYLATFNSEDYKVQPLPTWKFLSLEDLSLSELVKLDSVLEALQIIIETIEYSSYDLIKHGHGVLLLFTVIHTIPRESGGYLAASKILCQLCNKSEFIVACVQSKPPIVWQFLNILCASTTESTSISQKPTSYSTASQNLWNAAEAFVSNSTGLIALVNDGGLIVRLLGVLFAVKGYNHVYTNRVSAISLLTKCLWNPVHGGTVSAVLRRFLPEPIIILLKQSIGKSSLQLLDTAIENPELIWTNDMQSQVRQSILLIHEGCKQRSYQVLSVLNSQATVSNDQFYEFVSSLYGFRDTCNIPSSNFFVNYSRLDQEIFIGNVYIRLFLKQPTYKLKNPLFFLEKLIEQFDHCFNLQVPNLTEGSLLTGDNSTGESTSLELIVGKEDFLSLLVSCIICCLKNEHSLVEELIRWGFIDTCVQDYLYRINYYGRCGIPLLSILRFLNECANFMEFNDHLISFSVSSSSKIAKTGFSNTRHEFQKFNNIIFDLTFALIDNESISIDIDSFDFPWSELITRTDLKLFKDAIVIIELLRKIFACYHHEQILFLLHYSLIAFLPNLLIYQVINKNITEFSYLTNPSAVKFYSIDLLKSMLSIANERMTNELQSLLSKSNCWSEFRDQQHDLYISVSPFL